MPDIIEAIEHIEKYAAQGSVAFEQNELIQIWFLQHLQIIGEASRSLSPDIRASHPEVSWAKIIGMRNILVHHYFEIDLPVVWNSVWSLSSHHRRPVRRQTTGISPLGAPQDLQAGRPPAQRPHRRRKAARLAEIIVSTHHYTERHNLIADNHSLRLCGK